MKRNGTPEASRTEPPAPPASAGKTVQRPEANASALPQVSAGDGVLLRWLWRDYIRQRVPIMVLAMVIAALEGASAGILSLTMRPLLDEVLVAGQRDMLFVIAVVLAGIFVFRAAARLGAAAITAQVSERVAAQVQGDVLRHMLALDLAFFQKNAPGTLIERVRGDGEAMAQLFNRVLPNMARDVVAVVALLGVAFYTDWAWTLIVLVASPLVVLPIILMQRFVRRVTRNERVAAAETSRRLDEIFHGVVTLKLSGSQTRESRRFDKVLSGFVRARIFSVMGRTAIPSLVDLIAAVGIYAVLIYGGSQIIAGERTIGQLVSFVIAFGLLFDPLRNLGEVAGMWQAILASLERIWAIFVTHPTIRSPSPPQAIAPTPDECRISFENVSYSYDRIPAVRNMSFHIEPGERVAVVGRSGAGKSTLFLLLTRLVDPDSGRIVIGGHDIRTMDLAALRNLFSVVTQDTALFDDTLRENVLMGRPGASEAALHHALRTARVSDFLGDLSAREHTPVGPRGSALSGGQRQRVSIARAVLRDAPILLLDEPTSALDSDSEALVQEALQALGGARTTVIITHRMATAASADRILVLERGRLIEQGSHSELMARDTLYARLHAQQETQVG